MTEKEILGGKLPRPFFFLGRLWYCGDRNGCTLTPTHTHLTDPTHTYTQIHITDNDAQREKGKGKMVLG